MTEHRTRNRLMLVLLVTIGFLPMLLAWFVQKYPEMIPSYGNNGNLIVPVLPLESNVFSGVDEFSETNKDEIKAHWVLIHPVVTETCDTVCQEALYNTRQLRLMLNKDLTRVRRVLLVDSAKTPAFDEKLWKEDELLLRMSVDSQVFTRIKERVGESLENGMLIIMDPVGNLMMWYPKDFDPYAVRKDLKRLLNVSQIG